MIVLIVIYIIIALIQIPSLIKKKNTYDFVIFLVFYSATFVYAFLYVAGVELPSPMRAVYDLIVNKWNIVY